MRHGETRKLETEPRPIHEKPCLETVSRQDTRLETPSLGVGDLVVVTGK